MHSTLAENVLPPELTHDFKMLKFLRGNDHDVNKVLAVFFVFFICLVPFSLVPFSLVPFSLVQFSIVQFSSVQFSLV